MRTRTVILLMVMAGAAAAIGAWRIASIRDAGRREAVETSLFRSWARAEAGAGMSIVPKSRVPAASERTIRQVHDLPGFHEYAMRCSSCHVLPDPGAHEARRWAGTMDRMRHHIQRSGTMPPPEEELESALEFLRAAAERRDLR
jgi:hypothetical protein